MGDNISGRREKRGGNQRSGAMETNTIIHRLHINVGQLF